MSLTSQYSDFQSTNDSGFKNNNPESRGFSNKITYLNTNIPLFKPEKDVKQRVRFFPQPKEGYFAKHVLIHFGLNAEGNSLICPTTVGRNDCPLCAKNKLLYNEAKQLELAGNKLAAETKMKEAKGLRAKKYNITYMIDRNAEEIGPQVWSIPDTTVTGIRNLMTDPETNALLSIDDLFAGRDVFFVKGKLEPTSMFETINKIQLGTKDIPLSEGDKSFEQLSARTKGWLDFIKANSIASILNVVSAPEMERIAFGLTSLNEESVSSESTPSILERDIEVVKDVEPDPEQDLPLVKLAAPEPTKTIEPAVEEHETPEPPESPEPVAAASAPIASVPATNGQDAMAALRARLDAAKGKK